ncbi:MAG: formate/nitrite transporter family protein [Lachnospiraceae bacterium]|nr:formate/nitrite transporter family protein [Lachnospiraceae bacterium]
MGLKYLKTFLSAILAGICIGIGGIVYLSVESKLAGAFFFTTGLFVICIFGLDLFTGKVCYTFQRGKEGAVKLPIIFLGNFAGTWIMGTLVGFTRIAAVSEAATALCAVKLTDGYLSLFILGIFCNIMIYIAVEGYAHAPHELGKYLSLFFGVMVFILCGFEHSIADMFYFSAAKMWSTEAFLRILVIAAGNAAGGVSFPVLRGLLEK